MSSPVDSSFSKHFEFWDNFYRAAGSSGARKCGGCGRLVYAPEQVLCLSQAWHRSCLQCSNCGNRLSQSSYNDVDRALYCDACYRVESAVNRFASKKARAAESLDKSIEDSVLDIFQNVLLLSPGPSGIKSPEFGPIEGDKQRCAKSNVNADHTLTGLWETSSSLDNADIRNSSSDANDTSAGVFPSDCTNYSQPISQSGFVCGPRLDARSRSTSCEDSPKRSFGTRYDDGSAWKPIRNQDVDTSVGITQPKPTRRRFSSALERAPLERLKGEKPSVREIAAKINHAGLRTGGVIGVRTHHFCGGCNKTVHPDEQQRCLGRMWHRNCIRCSKCYKPLQSNVRYLDYSIDDVLFCDTCLSVEMTKKFSVRRKTLGDVVVPKELARDKCEPSYFYV
ncbi:uncharacterized protein LOC111243926 isoform X1 [Varroa destructor]|uniref:LIM zinc-binding domain-containing protein n=1 Tax=Varroa destructor TaxID=109461 RepID=A0A7M7JCI2_VARDE|nr:uncharacterized protein LOC111243926 isoform X1 [Varroa destructor]